MRECALFAKAYPIIQSTPTYPYDGTVDGFIATSREVRSTAGLPMTSNTILRCLEEWTPQFKVEHVRGVVIERLGKDIVFLRNDSSYGTKDNKILLFSSNMVMKTASIQEIYQDIEARYQ